MSLPIDIKTRRKELCLTQNELALISGCTQMQISNFESGKANLSLDTLERIATVLGLKLTLIPIDKANNDEDSPK